MLDLIMTFGLTNYVIKVDDVKLYNKQRPLNGDAAQDAVLLQNWPRRVPLVLAKKTSTHTLCF